MAGRVDPIGFPCTLSDQARTLGDQVATAKRHAPLWARLCAIFGCVLMLASGGAIIVGKILLARYAGAVRNQDLFGDSASVARGADIKGPLNVLLVGIDPRDATAAPLSDSIIVAHVPAGLDR